VQPPIVANAAGERARVLDASLSGVRLSHPAHLSERKRCTISIDWRGTPIEFVAELRWSKQQQGEYESGFEIQKIEPEAVSALRRLINECASRMQLYERHELVHGVWRTTTTTDAWQPEVGFTVASSESPHAVAFFRSAYSAGDGKMRERIRHLAKLSIEHPERLYDM
jgi:hypothetical protein